MKTRTLLLLLISGLAIAASPPGKADAGTPSYLERASSAMLELGDWYHWQKCHWYEPWTWGQLCEAGTWEQTLNWGWWDSANALDYTALYTQLSGDTSYLDLIQNGFGNRQDPDYVARNFTDDEGWWALGWIAAYDLPELRLRNPGSRYLERAQFIFNDMAAYWDSRCGGGIWWQKKPESYKNSIANELFMAIAAKLYRRTQDPKYLAWAKAEFHWFFEQSHLHTPGKLIVDGLDNSTCQVPPGSSTWTYNQGVVLEALIELGELELAKSIADTVLASAQLVQNGVLTEANEYTAGGCTGGDCPQFKGIFMRGLGALYRALPSADLRRAVYGSFIARSADALWAKDRTEIGGLSRFGVHWNGPVQGTLNATTQTSAVGALISAIPLDRTP